MHLTKLIARILQPRLRPAAAPQRRVRLLVEGLEDRRLMDASPLASPIVIANAPAQQQQIAQAQASPGQGYYRYYVAHYHMKMGQQCDKQVEVYTNKKQAENRAKHWQNKGFCTRISPIWTKPSPVPVHGPVVRG